MANAGDFYRGLVPVVEEDSVIATAETKAGLRRFEFFHIAGAVRQVTVDAMENLKLRSLDRWPSDRHELLATS